MKRRLLDSVGVLQRPVEFTGLNGWWIVVAQAASVTN